MPRPAFAAAPHPALGTCPVNAAHGPYVRVRPFREVCKRAFDVLAAVVGLTVLMPLFVLIAVLVKLDSPGPVFFRQVRIGRYRRPFRIWKFRKMYNHLARPGASLTRRYDARLTRVGRLLERTKLDELPQLLNVLLGEMSVVGPRPEVPQFVAHYPDRWDAVLSVKPGLFGPNQLRNRNESELYPPACEDLDGFYVRHILPPKLDADAAYARNVLFVKDLVLLVRCLLGTFAGAVTWQTLVNRRWQIANLLLLSGLGVGGMVVANWLTNQRSPAPGVVYSVVLACLVKPACLVAFRIPKALATSMTADDLLRGCWCAATSAALIIGGMLCANLRDTSRLALVFDTLLFAVALLLYKLLVYHAYVTFVLQASRELTRRLIIASLVVAPLSVAAAATLRHGFDAWCTPRKAPFLLLVCLAPVVRSLVLLLVPVRPSAKAGRGLAREWQKLALGAGIGSCFLVFLSWLLNERSLGRMDVAADLGMYLVGMTGIALWHGRGAQARRNARPGDSSGEAGEAPERLLIVGSGIELSAFIAALTVLPDHRFTVVGVITPYGRQRNYTVGGYRVLGQTREASEIAALFGITKIVVIKPLADRDSLDYLRAFEARSEIPVVSIDLLSPLCLTLDQG